MNSIIKVDGLSKKYDNEVLAVKEASLEIQEGEIVCILGRSGSGKSTLLRLLGGLEDADSGDIMICDERITGPSNNLVAGYDFIHFVRQDYRLPPFRTLEEILEHELYYAENDQARNSRIEELLKLARLEDKRNSFPRDLSGGERQRAAIAISLADDPEVLLMDEPFSNLDAPMKSEVRQEVFDILEQINVTTIFVSHDPADALSVADKVIILEQGQIVQIGTPREVYLNPKGINAARLFGPVNLIEIENSDRLAIRPERLKVEENGKYTGVVKKCKFFGHHYHLFIRTSLSEDELLIYHHRERNVGEQIFFDIEDS